jgi:hypothetical protein
VIVNVCDFAAFVINFSFSVVNAMSGHQHHISKNKVTMAPHQDRERAAALINVVSGALGVTPADVVVERVTSQSIKRLHPISGHDISGSIQKRQNLETPLDNLEVDTVDILDDADVTKFPPTDPAPSYVDELEFQFQKLHEEARKKPNTAALLALNPLYWKIAALAPVNEMECINEYNLRAFLSPDSASLLANDIKSSLNDATEVSDTCLTPGMYIFPFMIASLSQRNLIKNNT